MLLTGPAGGVRLRQLIDFGIAKAIEGNDTTNIVPPAKTIIDVAIHADF
jgi:hypothetical protein